MKVYSKLRSASIIGVLEGLQFQTSNTKLQNTFSEADVESNKKLYTQNIDSMEKDQKS